MFRLNSNFYPRPLVAPNEVNPQTATSGFWPGAARPGHNIPYQDDSTACRTCWPIFYSFKSCFPIISGLRRGESSTVRARAAQRADRPFALVAGRPYFFFAIAGENSKTARCWCRPNSWAHGTNPAPVKDALRTLAGFESVHDQSNSQGPR